MSQRDPADEGGDPPCWAHLFDEGDDLGDDRDDDLDGRPEDSEVAPDK